MKRIHIVGSGPRTGTTLLTEAMKVCFNIDHYCEHEASITYPASELSDKKEEIVLTKCPGEIYLMNWAVLFDPSLYVICVLRDPRDMVVSRHGAYPDQYYCSLRYWDRFNTHYRMLRDHKRFLLIKYEDLVTEPDKVQKTIQMRFPFLQILHPFRDFHKIADINSLSENALKGVRPIEPKEIGNWRNHLERVKQQLSLHGDISDGLIEFGYEENKDWLSLLDNVPLREIETKTREFFSNRTKRTRKKKLRIIFNTIAEKLGLKPKRVIKSARRCLTKVRFL